MMTEKYPTWLTGHVKEWAEKRLPIRHHSKDDG